MWNYAHNRRSTAGYTSEKTSGWICSRIAKDRCRRSGHGNTSPIPKTAPWLSKHVSLIQSGMCWRKRLIPADRITQVETLSTHDWINKSWTCSSYSSAWTQAPEISFSALYRRTRPLSSTIKHLCSCERDRFLHFEPCPGRSRVCSPARLLQPGQRLPAGSRAGLAPPGFPPWARGSDELEMAGQNPAQTSGWYLIQ